MTVKEQIYNAFDLDKTVVFPTETSARSYLASYLKSRKGKAVLTDKAVSIDIYRESKTNYPNDRSQAVAVDRMVFVYDFLSRNAENLKYFKKTSLKEIFKALPDFKKLLGGNLSKELKEDVELILKEYEEYLEKNGLYEKNFYESETLDSEDTVFAFSDAYLEGTLKLNKAKCINAECELPEIKVFKNSLAEIRTCMRNTLKLLQNNVKARDIVITVTDINSTKGILEQEASKRGIKLAFMQGEALSSYPAGRMFSAISKIYSEDYSIQSLKEFLLDPVYPFLKKETAINLVKIALFDNCIDGGKDASVLKKKLEHTNDPKLTGVPEALDYLIKLTQFIKGICKAEDCQALRKALKGFQDEFFLPGSWDSSEIEENRLVFQRCMATLDSLEKVLLRSNIKTENVYELFCSVLNNTTYMLQNKEGIKVYPYPLSVGIAAKYHFVLGLDDSLARVCINKNPFGGKISNTEALQIGDFVIKAYCAEADGLKVSCACETYTGNSIPPALFVEADKLEYVEKTEKDSFYDEEEIWNGKAPQHKALKVQKESFELACERGFNSRNKIIPPKAEIPYRVSASRLKDFQDCPFKYMCEYVLNIEDIDFDVVMTDHKELGNVLHDTYEQWFNEVKSYERAKSDESIARLNEILEENIEKYRKNPSSPSDVYISFFKKKYSKVLPLIVKSKSGDEILSDTVIVDTEKKINIETEKYNIKGSIDAIFKTTQDDYVVIDFKKGKAPDEKTQIALYAKSLEKLPVSGAFYSIGDSKFSAAFQDPVELNKIIDECDALIAKNVEALEKNSFETTPDKDNCKNCPYSRICRKRYVIK